MDKNKQEELITNLIKNLDFRYESYSPPLTLDEVKSAFGIIIEVDANDPNPFQDGSMVLNWVADYPEIPGEDICGNYNIDTRGLAVDNGYLQVNSYAANTNPHIINGSQLVQRDMTIGIDLDRGPLYKIGTGYILAAGHSGVPYYPFAIDYDPGNYIGFRVYSGGAEKSYNVSLSNLELVGIDLTQRLYIHFTTSSSSCILYVNGIEVLRADVPHEPYTDIMPDLGIGQSPYKDSYDEGLYGFGVRRIVAFNRELTSDEIKVLANATNA